MEIRDLFHGALEMEMRDGYAVARRFTANQIEACAENKFFHDRTHCTASVTLEFFTDSERISFDYKFFLRTGVVSTFEVYTDGFLMYMQKDSELPDEGTLLIELPKGRKRVEIYIPNYSEVGINNFIANGIVEADRKKRTKVLFIGDSITQGGGPMRSGQTFVNVLKRELDYEVLNWGIGGYRFDEKIVQKTSFEPDKIVVAFGTNHRNDPKEKIERAILPFFEKLNALYPCVPTLVILPPWAGDASENMIASYKEVKRLTEETAGKYPQMQTASAYDMIPHFSDYFMEDLVHPSALGMEIYGQNLIKTIRRRGF